MGGYRDLVDDIRGIVARTIPPQAAVAVVSRGDAALLDLDGRSARHFPEARPGVYAGYHPADSAAAVAALDEAVDGGVQFLLFPGTAYWWLDHYAGFTSHLRDHAACIWSDACCVIYRLRPRASGAAA
ncbi:hypothetical protein D3C83_03770 [compost metagenome]